jgi:hypothetical protein
MRFCLQLRGFTKLNINKLGIRLNEELPRIRMIN